MTKQEFKAMCDRILKCYGFAKTHGQYYLDLSSDILGAMFFQASDYGSAYYLNCGFAIKTEMAVPYPKLTDVNFSWRIAVPVFVRLCISAAASAFLIQSFDLC